MKASFVLYSSMSNYLPLHPSIHPSSSNAGTTNGSGSLLAHSDATATATCGGALHIAHTYRMQYICTYSMYMQYIRSVPTYYVCTPVQRSR